MSLVDNEGVVAQEIRIGLDLRKENSVRHELDHRVRAHLFGEADLIAHNAA